MKKGRAGMGNLLRNSIIIAILGFIPGIVLSQCYPPQVGLAGSDAIKADSAIFKEWAKKCYVWRGYIDIADTTKTYDGSNKATFGTPENAIGKVGGVMDVVSLGDKGIAVLSFEKAIKDGEGPDFVIFENGLRNYSNDTLGFLELAFVEVSSDSINFVRFPAISLTPFERQVGGFENLDARNLKNLAGKYISGYGTPFDLIELKDSARLDINNVRYVKIIDVCGSISKDYASFDSKGNKINDPYPTPFASCGFDLNAVGVININTNEETGIVRLYPNPVDDFLFFNSFETKIKRIEIYDMFGKLLRSEEVNCFVQQMNLSDISKGVYLIRIFTGNGIISKKVIKK